MLITDGVDCEDLPLSAVYFERLERGAGPPCPPSAIRDIIDDGIRPPGRDGDSSCGAPVIRLRCCLCGLWRGQWHQAGVLGKQACRGSVRESGDSTRGVAR